VKEYGGLDISEALIERIVRGFYVKIRADGELGPIFESVVQDRWEPHLLKMMDFWSSVMLKTHRYNGRPVPKHVALTQVRPAHFDRWLELFRENAREVCSDVIAERFIERAEVIAKSFKLGMFRLPNPREFPERPAP
jgi:hemoglobin